MKKIILPILFTTSILAVYAISIQFDATLWFGMFIFSVSPVFIIWMVYRILKDGVQSDLKFEDRFYEDYGDRLKSREVE
ncbi:MAG: hypothetical protein AAFQ94_29715 [Bacteroidota bacterium]